MNNTKKQIVLCSVLLLGTAVFLYQSFNIKPELLAPKYTSEQEQASPYISKRELRSFLKTLMIYKEQNAMIPFKGNLSYSTQENLSNLNPYMADWLQEHGWKAERFFYIGARLKIIMDTIQRDKEIKKLQTLMLEGINVAPDENMVKSLKNLAQEQERLLNIEKISQEERQMVETEQESIENLLKSFN